MMQDGTDMVDKDMYRTFFNCVKCKLDGISIILAIFEMNIKDHARKNYLSDLIFENILAKTCSSFGILKGHRMQE